MSLPSAWNELLESARVLLDAGRIEDARTNLQSLLLFEFPDTSHESIAAHHARLRLALDIADACVDRSESLIRQGQMDQGLALYELAVELRADIANLHERLGDAHLKLVEIDDAIAAYTSAARLAEPEHSVHQKLASALDQKRDPRTCWRDVE